MLAQSALVAILFLLIHLEARRLVFLGGVPRSVWLSAAGGVSVAYVFLHLLPELHAGQEALQEAGLFPWLPRDRSGIYLVALVGLTVFYGLERLAARSRARRRAAGAADSTDSRAFALHLGAFALYNLVIGYLLLHGERSDLLMYGVALGLHFVVNDHALREHHKEQYDGAGRWVLAAAVVAGWLLGLWLELPEAVVLILIALLAGAVILNVLKEELPEQRESRFAAFLAGAVLYGALLLAI